MSSLPMFCAATESRSRKSGRYESCTRVEALTPYENRFRCVYSKELRKPSPVDAPGRTSMITRATHKSGEPIYVDMSFAMVTDAGGKLLGSAAIARDATKRFNDQKALRKQLAELTAKPAG